MLQNIPQSSLSEHTLVQQDSIQDNVFVTLKIRTTMAATTVTVSNS